VVFRKGCTEEDGALRKCPVDIFSEGARLQGGSGVSGSPRRRCRRGSLLD